MLAILLGISVSDFDRIHSDSTSMAIERQAIIRKWLQSTWAGLVRALKDDLVKQGALANEIAANHHNDSTF